MDNNPLVVIPIFEVIEQILHLLLTVHIFLVLIGWQKNIACLTYYKQYLLSKYCLPCLS